MFSQGRQRVTDIRHGDQTTDVLPSGGAYHPDPFLLEPRPPNPDNRPVAHIVHGSNRRPTSRSSGTAAGMPAGHVTVSGNRRRRRRRYIASHFLYRTRGINHLNTYSQH